MVAIENKCGNKVEFIEKVMREKKQILIVTLYDDNNIGNRLQNYALQQVLSNRGVDVTVIDNGYTTVPSAKDIIKIYIKCILGSLGIGKYKKQFQIYRSTKKIRNASYKFDRNNIKKVVKVSNKEAFEKEWLEYDLAFAGSDQIWHKWSDDELELPFYYLEFLPENKRVAYAASFGFEEFPAADVKQHKEGIKGMKYISCREKSGCKLVSSIEGKEAEQVLDPTLLLNVAEWRSIEEQASECVKNQKNYAFVYFLGERTKEYNEFIKVTASRFGVDKIIDPLHDDSCKIDEFGPCEFLSLIDNAKYVFTDSFHCTVFSVLFDESFTVFRRKQPGFEKMFGRIEGLLSSKGKLEHIYGGSSVEASNDFEELYLNSLNYIDNVLGIIVHENK